MGNKVGLLDADVFGPSIPLMMNLSETPLVNDLNLMLPPINYNVKWYDYSYSRDTQPYYIGFNL